ncbi:MULTISPECIES: dephospho-CoA kinase [unclassified Polynucleobacter]|uniref:dephospho-CoA kinase n=1 Tax=unclassified Polynucleobacter TaxID=2640945 RepID=UPI001C0D69A0|nr:MULTISPECIES: dephospho-CoA kinase [unclassified Polynucleobacter]MBU3604274.1 dephospho-CoA kinase [Polynucleobacter sp. AP-Kaivos-20-H2]MBU3619087.1 dephospho-CoA kinase [Polynucleobacter sp. JS-Fieb-80-E5]
MATNPTNPPSEQADLGILKGHVPFVGLTGGIGSGKTAVSDQLAQLGAGIVDTDLIAHQITAPNGVAIPFIQKQFGSDFVGSSGALDRVKMRTLVFANPQARKSLEAITHPLIREETIRQAKQLIEDQVPYLVFVVPLLVESGNWAPLLDYLIVVDCPEETQIERVMHRSKLPRNEVERILKAQASREERISRADMVIENQGSLENLKTEVLKLNEKILQIQKDRTSSS